MVVFIIIYSNGWILITFVWRIQGKILCCEISISVMYKWAMCINCICACMHTYLSGCCDRGAISTDDLVSLFLINPSTFGKVSIVKSAGEKTQIAKFWTSVDRADIKTFLVFRWPRRNCRRTRVKLSRLFSLCFLLTTLFPRCLTADSVQGRAAVSHQGRCSPGGAPTSDAPTGELALRWKIAHSMQI